MAAFSADRVRAFVALALETAVSAEIRKVQQRLTLPGGMVRWVNPEQLHLTLQFLGNVATERVENLSTALRGACALAAPFQLALEGIGGFPNTRSPRVVWIGIQGELDLLQTLQERVAQATQQFGDHREQHAFRPHLTIGRVKAYGSEARKVGRAIEAANVPKLGDWAINQVLLLRSELSSDGARYTTLATIALGL